MSVVQRTGGMRQQYNRNNFNPNQNRGQKFVQNKRYVNNRIPGQGLKVVFGPKQNRDAVIARNLEHMKQMAIKKRMAQEMYYGANRSPMVKTNPGPFIKQEVVRQDSTGRPSVQQRLGNKTNIVRRNNNFNNNTKPVFLNRRNTQQGFNGGLRSDKIMRVQNLQQRRLRNRNQPAPRPGAVKMINPAGKVVYLQQVQRPSNYTVRVENDRKQQAYKHHVQKDLNPLLQQEIKLIQSKSVRQIVSPVLPVAPIMPQAPAPVAYEPIDRLPIMSTARTLNERFSMI